MQLSGQPPASFRLLQVSVSFSFRAFNIWSWK